MKKRIQNEYESLRDELVKNANELESLYNKSIRDSYYKKRKSTINKIRYKISNLTIEDGDI